jgi:hypothetical protein
VGSVFLDANSSTLLLPPASARQQFEKTIRT